MCGIFAVLHPNNITNNVDKFLQNAELLVHRGDQSNSCIIDNKIFMYHRRLAINDLSTNGTQPLMNSNIFISVNGEIYNYPKLKQLVSEKLPYYKFKSGSDSEIIIPLYLLFGNEFINMLEGMFSFVLYDKTNDIFIVGRDHIGITSLYYTWTKSKNNEIIVYISSEMKALVGLDNIGDIENFKPGNIMVVKNNNFSKYSYYNPRWKMNNYHPKGDLNYEVIKNTLISSVKKHTLSDQPIGILLSGGLDSSLIASIMVKLKNEGEINNPIRTFTIGLENAEDILAAQQVADFIKSDHTAYTFTVDEAIKVIPDVVYHTETYDITTIRASIPLYILSKKIKEDTDIKVLLSGEGSDELMAGYLYFHKAPNSLELQNELRDKVTSLHKYDCLRAHKATLASTIELRVPFLDKVVIDYFMNIDPLHKMINKSKPIEKYILREAFNDGTFLPQEILLRTKAQFSDAVSSKTENVIDSIKLYAETKISHDNFLLKDKLFPIHTPISKEQMLYRNYFAQAFPNESCIKTCDFNNKSIACSTERALKWLNINEFSMINDPSGRSMNMLNKKNNLNE